MTNENKTNEKANEESQNLKQRTYLSAADERTAFERYMRKADHLIERYSRITQPSLKLYGELERKSKAVMDAVRECGGLSGGKPITLSELTRRTQNAFDAMKDYHEVCDRCDNAYDINEDLVTIVSQPLTKTARIITNPRFPENRPYSIDQSGQMLLKLNVVKTQCEIIESMQELQDLTDRIIMQEFAKAKLARGIKHNDQS